MEIEPNKNLFINNKNELNISTPQKIDKTQLNLLIRKKIYLQLDSFFSKLNKIINNKILLLKLKFFKDLKIEGYYNRKFKKELNKHFAYDSLNKSDANIKDPNVEANAALYNNQSINQLSTKNLILFDHEKYLIEKKLANLLGNVSKKKTDQNNFVLMKKFHKWRFCSTIEAYLQRMKSEHEKKYLSEFESKIKHTSKQVKKLEKERVELTIKNDLLLQSIKVYTLKINTLQEKENEFKSKLRTLTSEKKKILSALQKNEANIEKKIKSLESKSKDLENKMRHFKEAQKVKEKFMSSYIEDMNHILDFFETKTCNLLLNF